ncbi:hypothetical protein PoB_002654000 [Plakobranchus ocellatus]|uniref:Uncharacterized protein n=1 Tax=Plakobranchus ocellatus TaxID=259542 RepID=A0AAV3ZXV6_9GAST|nr:hypothetical protein PoB_002654000 [Plakobranchus ocellatus]
MIQIVGDFDKDLEDQSSIKFRNEKNNYENKCVSKIASRAWDVDGTVASESALRSAGTLLWRIRAAPPGLAEGLKA